MEPKLVETGKFAIQLVEDIKKASKELKHKYDLNYNDIMIVIKYDGDYIYFDSWEYMEAAGNFFYSLGITEEISLYLEFTTTEKEDDTVLIYPFCDKSED